uniref:Phosphatidylinositol-3-phosphatase SAC1 n=1 Tax=Plectus sambesii TaxID=2011161 RepID=A0A914V0H9_9BILA
MAVGRCFRVYQKYVQGSPFSLIVENTRNSEDFLLFESGVVASLQNEGCEEFKRAYTRLVDAYGIMGIVQLFGQNNVHNDYLLLVTAVVSVGKINECDIYRVNGVQFVPMWRALPDGVIDPGDDRITEMQKLMSNGMFYFAFAADQSQLIDLSLCSQKRHQGSISDYRFFWNRTLHLPLQRFGVDTSKWLLRCMCGSVFMRTVYVGHRTAKACVISRLSCERMGTRFNVRGVNDYGHVANFVETEQVIFFEDQETSFVQTRGSIPLFWEQPGVQVGSHKVKLSRGFEASAPAYDRHFKLLKSYYGDQVIVNLLGSKEGEKMLSQAFKTHHDNSPHAKDVVSVTFDYHSMVRMGNKVQNMAILWRQLESCMHKFGYFHAEKNRVTRKQTGAVRTNCLDCLDRTNCVQTFLGLQALPWQLAQLRMESSQANVQTRFEEVFRDLWQKNGDQCSVIYAGTGALEGKSKFKDASRSVARTIQNNLMDGSKQEAMDLLLLGSADDGAASSVRRHVER